MAIGVEQDSSRVMTTPRNSPEGKTTAQSRREALGPGYLSAFAVND